MSRGNAPDRGGGAAPVSSPRPGKSGGPPENREPRRSLAEQFCHRIKNDLQTLANLMSLAADYSASPQELARSMQGRCHALSVPYTLAARARGAPRLDRLAGELLRRVLAPAALRPELDLRLPPLVLGLRLASSLSLWLHEILDNAARHALAKTRGARLSVSSRQDREQMVLRVCDNGPGLPPGFDPAGDAGMGLTLARALAEHDLGGGMELAHREPGLEVRLLIPRPELESLNREVRP